MIRVYLKSGAVVETDDNLKSHTKADLSGELREIEWTWPGLDAGALVALRYLDLSQVVAIVQVWTPKEEPTP